MNFNGWKNWETWNVALWISNDEGLYRMAARCDDYAEFTDNIWLFKASKETPDGASWTDSSLDLQALDELIEETV